MKVLFTFLLMLSFEAHAQKKLSSQAFQSSVRPILSGILSDFYQMITLFPDFPKELVSIVDEIDDLHGEKELIREKCPRNLGLACLENITKLRNRLVGVQAKTLELISRQRMSPSLHMNPLAGIRTTNEFMIELEDIKGSLDNAALILKAGASFKKPTFQVIKKVDELSTFVSLTVVEYIPFTYKEDFRHFYFNFIHPVQQQLGKTQNYEFLNRNIATLNFSLNLLNQNLTKRNKKTPEGMGPYLSVIHNRWNSLLRYYY
ncbi:MAG: hypothetical protein H0V66_16200 [Bdellovibrionales bacterium]|nr:hypothetical protein [Bdellovibrionales bacterium]